MKTFMSCFFLLFYLIRYEPFFERNYPCPECQLDINPTYRDMLWKMLSSWNNKTDYHSLNVKYGVGKKQLQRSHGNINAIWFNFCQNKFLKFKHKRQTNKLYQHNFYVFFLIFYRWFKDVHLIYNYILLYINIKI